MEYSILEVKNISAFFGEQEVVKNISFNIPARQIIAIMGPSGCGKTTLLRCMNRLHELNSAASVKGEILLHKENIFLMDPIALRLKIGMVFQRPNPFPNFSIYDNVLAGYKLNGWKLNRQQKDEIVETALKKAALWDEVKDVMNKKGTFLSGGQQQRLCIARAIAMSPEVLLLDEPTSALDPISTLHVEELLKELKKNYTLIIVTHNMQQASRISDRTAFLYMGELVEYGNTEVIFNNPKDQRTKKYLEGQFS